MKDINLSYLVGLIKRKYPDYQFIGLFYEPHSRENGLYMDIQIRLNKGKKFYRDNFIVFSIHLTRDIIDKIDTLTKEEKHDQIEEIYKQLVSVSKNGIIHIHSDNNTLFETKEFNCNFKISQPIEKDYQPDIKKEPTTANTTPTKIYKPSNQIEYTRNIEARENKICNKLLPIFDKLLLAIQDVLFTEKYMVKDIASKENYPISSLKPKVTPKPIVFTKARSLFQEKYLKYKAKYLALKQQLKIF